MKLAGPVSLEPSFGERLAWVASNCITGYLMHDRKIRRWIIAKK